MKIRKSIVMAALLTTVFAGPVLAQISYPGSYNASAPASKDTQKEKAEHDSALLPPEKAKLYNQAMQKAVDENKDLRDQIRKAHEETDEILTAEKFDKTAFLAKAAELDKLYAKMRDKTNAAFISVVETFTQEDRKILVKARNDHRRRAATQQAQ